MLLNKLPGKKFFRLAVSALTLLGLSIIASPKAEASFRGLYVGNEFYVPSSAQQTAAHNSNFTALFLFTLHVASNGDIYYNDTLVVSNGNYVGDPNWYWTLQACRGGSVNRIEAALGCWGDQSFTNIQNLIAWQGTGSGSILYRNFQAFLWATGVNSIQFDDETTYDVNSMVAFGRMLVNIGTRVTLCPYTNQSFWVNVFNQLGTGCVDHIYVQCYDGGAGNDPVGWSSAFGYRVYPGLWGNTDTTDSVATKMYIWQQREGMHGGFMWLNGSMPWDAPKWGTALFNGLESTLDVASNIYDLRVRHTDMALNAYNGDNGNGTPLIQWPYDGANNSKWQVTQLGGGQYSIIGVASGRSIDVYQGSTQNGEVIKLYDYLGGNNQKVTMNNEGDGYRSLSFLHSGKGMVVQYASTAQGALVIQWDNNGTTNGHWLFRLP